MHSQQKSLLAGDRISALSNILSKEAALSATLAISEEVAALPLAASLQINGSQQAINAFSIARQRRFCRLFYVGVFIM